MNAKVIEAYECESCHGKYFDKYLADQCCKIYSCRVCGIELDKYHLICDSCLDKIYRRI